MRNNYILSKPARNLIGNLLFLILSFILIVFIYILTRDKFEYSILMNRYFKDICEHDAMAVTLSICGGLFLDIIIKSDDNN